MVLALLWKRPQHLRESSQIRWPSLSKGLSNTLTTIGTGLARIEAEPIFESSIGTARPS
jgi:hypothetical protein